MQMRFIKLWAFSVASIFLVGPSLGPLCGEKTARAQPTIEDLLNQVERPTMQQLEEALNPWPATNPFKGGTGRGVSDISSSRLPRAIAAFEMAFPGGTYLEVGRDAVFAGDVLDAFYTSIGQPGRVRRADVSNISFKRYGADLPDEMTYRFLRDNTGLDLAHIDSGYPYVLFDVTSFSHTSGVGGGASQSVRLTRAIYQAYAAMGHDPRQLVRKVNFISIAGGARSPEFFSPGFDLEKFFALQAKDTTAQAGPLVPMHIQLPMSMTYTDAWHDMFTSFEETSDGRVIAPPGSPNTKAARAAILADMYSARNAVRDPRFLEEVRYEALLLGYVFPETRTQTLTLASPEVVQKAKDDVKAREEERRRREIERRKIEMAEKRSRRNIENDLSEDGANYLDAFEDELHGGDAIGVSIAKIRDLRDRANLTRADIAAVMKTAMSATYVMDSEPIRRELIEAIRAVPRIRDAWINEPFKLDPYGENEYRIGNNVDEMAKRVPRMAAETATKLTTGQGGAGAAPECGDKLGGGGKGKGDGAKPAWFRSILDDIF